MIRILLLSAGTNACYHVAKTLKTAYEKDFFIIGADINEACLIPTIGFLDRFYKVPYTSDPSYYEEILNICRKEKVDVILPSFDADQKMFYPENPDLQNMGVLSLGTSERTLPVYADKMKMHEFLEIHGLPLPQMYKSDEIQDEQEYFIKPKNGVASQGAKKVAGRELKKLEQIENFLIQEVCFEPEYTLECFYFCGELYSVTRERIAAKAGVCVKARVFQDKQLHAIAEKFVSVLDVPYYFNLQFMQNTFGESVITDVNLRMAGGMSLSFAAGWDEVAALADILLNRTNKEICSHLCLRASEQYVVRAYTDIVTKEVM